MSFTTISPEELVGMGVTGLPDTPGLSTEDMQAQFDEYPIFLKDKFINLINELEALTAASNIGAEVPTNITADGNIQSILEGLRVYVDQTVVALGSGDMARAIYDPDRDGIIAPEQGGTGETSLQASRNAMGLGNTLEALPIENGGTGQTTVAKARNALGLGNTSGALPVANGGTGTTDGTLNGVKLATDTTGGVTRYGYKIGNTFKAFKDPTGTASSGDVLSGKTFANAASDNIVTGSMPDYSGSNRRTVNPSGGTGNEQLSLSVGYHDSVIVNRTNPYNAGYNAAQRKTWNSIYNCLIRNYGSQSLANLSTILDLTCVNVADYTNCYIDFAKEGGYLDCLLFDKNGTYLTYTSIPSGSAVRKTLTQLIQVGGHNAGDVRFIGFGTISGTRAATFHLVYWHTEQNYS